jgi:hypothetical protein
MNVNQPDGDGALMTKVTAQVEDLDAVQVLEGLR